MRCYSDAGYDEQMTVTDTKVYLTGIDPTVSYTVEVTAAGMTQPARTSITANPLSISALNVDDSETDSLTLPWDYTGTAPTGGWLLMYTVDGSDSSVVKCDEASAVISPRIPGAKYQFTLQAADATSIFNNVHTYTCPEAEDFSEGGLSAAEITVSLLVRPEDEDWTYDSISNDLLTDEFASGDAISIVLHGTINFLLPDTDLDVLFVIRDAYGNVLPDLASQAKSNWNDLWFDGDYHYGELDLPTAPTDPGEYSLTIYFNGCKAGEATFSITE